MYVFHTIAANFKIHKPTYEIAEMQILKTQRLHTQSIIYPCLESGAQDAVNQTSLYAGQTLPMMFSMCL